MNFTTIINKMFHRFSESENSMATTIPYRPYY